MSETQAAPIAYIGQNTYDWLCDPDRSDRSRSMVWLYKTPDACTHFECDHPVAVIAIDKSAKQTSLDFVDTQPE